MSGGRGAGARHRSPAAGGLPACQVGSRRTHGSPKDDAASISTRRPRRHAARVWMRARGSRHADAGVAAAPDPGAHLTGEPRMLFAEAVAQSSAARTTARAPSFSRCSIAIRSSRTIISRTSRRSRSAPAPLMPRRRGSMTVCSPAIPTASGSRRRCASRARRARPRRPRNGGRPGGTGGERTRVDSTTRAAADMSRPISGRATTRAPPTSSTRRRGAVAATRRWWRAPVAPPSSMPIRSCWRTLSSSSTRARCCSRKESSSARRSDSSAPVAPPTRLSRATALRRLAKTRKQQGRFDDAILGYRSALKPSRRRAARRGTSSRRCSERRLR